MKDAASPISGPVDGRLVQGLRRRRTDADADAPAHLVARRRRAQASRPTPDSRRDCCASTRRRPAGARSLQGHSLAEWEPIGGPPVLRNGRAIGAASTAGRRAEGRHHQPERRLAAQERRRLQREHDADSSTGTASRFPTATSGSSSRPSSAIRATCRTTTRRSMHFKREAGRLEMEAHAVPLDCADANMHQRPTSSLCACVAAGVLLHRAVVLRRARASRRRRDGRSRRLVDDVERRGAADPHRSRARARQLHRLPAQRRRAGRRRCRGTRRSRRCPSIRRGRIRRSTRCAAPARTSTWARSSIRCRAG